MANLGKKGDVYVVRFRLHGREHKKSLKVRDREAAEAARNLVELTLHRLKTGQVRIPPGVDPADFIVSGGVLTEPVRNKPDAAPTPGRLAATFLEARQATLAPSTHKLFGYHLRRWIRHLREAAGRAIDRVTHGDLENYLRLRIGETSGTTAAKVTPQPPELIFVGRGGSCPVVM